jgi:hypothetical protein
VGNALQNVFAHATDKNTVLYKGNPLYTKFKILGFGVYLFFLQMKSIVATYSKEHIECHTIDRAPGQVILLYHLRHGAEG